MKNKFCVALGYFDGVHLGHNAVLKAAINTEYEPAVFTFNSREKNNITTDEAKQKLINSLGIENIFSYDFEEVKNYSPEEFVSEILVKKLNAGAVVCGYDFRFGKDAKAGAQELTKLCNKFDIETIIIPPVKIADTCISSSLIRAIMLTGDIATANIFLGYEHFYELEIVGGNMLGRTIGFPTVNQNMPENCVFPRLGVYASSVFVHGKRYKGITNIGVKPTAGENKNVTIETHIVGYDGDLYGKTIKVSLLKFIRAEKKFNNFSELSKQIEEDIKMAHYKIRTRFAPSPTGFMHLGVLRTALYAWLFAKKNNGTFILRIEDTDRARYVEGTVDVIYDTLKTCGLHWNEGPDVGGDFAPYIQSERKDSYMKYAEILIEKGAAYKQDGAVFQKMPTSGSTSFHDEVFGEITVNNEEIEDQVLIKSDGMPTYNFANVIDDHLMEITHIIRGSEFLSSTPKYILLYEALGWKPPVFIHVAPIMRDASNKLSKRDGDAYFSDFIEKGYLVEAIINYIALLGWSPRGTESENEFFTLSELTKVFNLDGISKSPAIFDEVKMRAINAHYIRNLSPEKFKILALPFIANPPKDVDVLCAALQQRTEVLTDITAQVNFVENVCEYELDLYNNKKMKTTPDTALSALEQTLAILRETEFIRDEIFEAFKDAAEILERKAGYFLYPLQVALTGKSAVPGGGLDVLIMLGRDEATKRINSAIMRLKSS